MGDYICLHGDCDNYALTKDDCFVVLDDVGRNWLCYEPDDIAGEIDRLQSDLGQMQAKAYALGFAQDGTSLSVVLRMKRNVLPEWLAQS